MDYHVPVPTPSYIQRNRRETVRLAVWLGDQVVAPTAGTYSVALDRMAIPTLAIIALKRLVNRVAISPGPRWLPGPRPLGRSGRP